MTWFVWTQEVAGREGSNKGNAETALSVLRINLNMSNIIGCTEHHLLHCYPTCIRGHRLLGYAPETDVRKERKNVRNRK